METAICVKCWLQKVDLRILKSVICLGFSNIKEFSKGWNFGCLWCNLKKNIDSICCTYQNHCRTFTNVFGFLLNFSTSWKSCVKEQWPKKSLYHIFNFWHGLVLEAIQRVEYIWVPESMTNDWVCKGQTKLNMYSVFSEQIKSLSSNQSKWNFWNRLHPKVLFWCRLLTQTASWRLNQPILTL